MSDDSRHSVAAISAHLALGREAPGLHQEQPRLFGLADDRLSR
jgi:hypothetical protein